VRPTTEAACARCGEPLGLRADRCQLCGAPSAGAFVPGPLEPHSVLARRLWTEWAVQSRRFGMLPLLSLVGVLPLFPLSPVVGIAAGGFALRQIARGEIPDDSRRLALVGIMGGLFWLCLGIYAVSHASEFIQNTPFVPEPLKWFWNWEIGREVPTHRL
jgi:hypothetical protein